MKNNHNQLVEIGEILDSIEKDMAHICKKEREMDLEARFFQLAKEHLVQDTFDHLLSMAMGRGDVLDMIRERKRLEREKIKLELSWDIKSECIKLEAGHALLEKLIEELQGRIQG